MVDTRLGNKCLLTWPASWKHDLKLQPSLPLYRVRNQHGLPMNCVCELCDSELLIILFPLAITVILISEDYSPMSEIIGPGPEGGRVGIQPHILLRLTNEPREPVTGKAQRQQ